MEKCVLFGKGVHMYLLCEMMGNLCALREGGKPVSSWGRGVNVCLLGRGGKPVSSWGKGLNLCLFGGSGYTCVFLGEGGVNVCLLGRGGKPVFSGG